MIYCRYDILFGLSLAIASIALAEMTIADDGPNDGNVKTAVRAASREYSQAVRNGDVQAMRRSWTEDGDYVNAAGRKFKAQELLKTFAEQGKSEQPSNEITPTKSSIRLITQSVAIEDGTYECGQVADGNELTGRFTALWVKQGDRWLLDSLRETVIDTPGLDAHLKPLSWLLGEWVAETENAVMLVSARLSDRGNYIIREFAILGNGGDVTATERIAWDSASGGIRSWTFDSQDGRSEAIWKRDGKGWVVDTTEVMADGKVAKTVASIAPEGREAFVWDVKSTKVNGQNVPPQRVIFKRAPERE